MALTADPRPGAAYAPPTAPLRVLHLDDDLIFVDKPAGLLSVPGKGPGLADCLLARLVARFPEALLVHRLDRDTSGVMVFARTPAAQRHLGLQFERRRLTKTYIARVVGCPATDGGRIDLPLAADWPNRPRQHVDRKNGRAAQTDWHVISRGANGTARLRLHPRTGRSHQLRVHLAEIGHPILGDPLYGAADAPAAPRLMLHATELTLRRPTGGEPLTVSARVPF